MSSKVENGSSIWRRTRLLALRALPLLVVIPLLAQEVGFEVTTRLVQTPVFVNFAGRGALIDALTPRDFVVKDNGQVSELTSIVQGQDRPPMTLLFLIESFHTQVRL